MIRDRIEALIAAWPATNGDPPDTDYQSGYLAACEEHARELIQILAEEEGGPAPRPASEWHEGLGDVLWWRFPIEEPPYVGSPRDVGLTVEIHAPQGVVARGDVGGWPDYHTHFTPIPTPQEPGHD